MKLFLLTFIFFMGPSIWASQVGHFSGRISKINAKLGLVRVRVNFDNVKYLNRENGVEFFEESRPNKRCISSLEGKSAKYLLLRVNNFFLCNSRVNFTVGGYIRLYSEDLEENVKKGKEVVKLLLKKRYALDYRFKQRRIELESYLAKVEAVNERYQALKKSLETEWQKEISDLEEDRIVALRNYKSLQIMLGEVDYKLEQYKVRDRNLKIDRWALDRKNYRLK